MEKPRTTLSKRTREKMLRVGKVKSKALKESLENIGANDPGGMLQRLTIRRDLDIAADEEVWQLKPEAWTEEQAFLLFNEARQLCLKDAYNNLGLLWGHLGITMDVAKSLVRRFEAVRFINEAIRDAVKHNIMQDAQEGRINAAMALFNLRCNFGMKEPEASAEPVSVSIEMAKGAKSMMEKMRKADGELKSPTGEAPKKTRGKGKKKAKGKTKGRKPAGKAAKKPAKEAKEAKKKPLPTPRKIPTPLKPKA